MPKKPSFDLAEAHRFFAADCFNRAWDLIEKQDRTPAEDRRMVALNQASLFHWMERPDVTDRNMSIGYWQASRIQALIGEAAEARRYAEICLGYSQDLEPFYLGYAHEALARASLVAGDATGARRSLAEAEQLASKVGRKDDRNLLRSDLEALKSRL